jgi:hypothetical protein
MPFAAAIEERLSPGATVCSAPDPSPEAAAAPDPAFARAPAPSASLGTSIVWPATTCASSGSPLYAATVPVVRLFCAAIDHSVSPGWTVWGTEAPAGPAAIAARTRERLDTAHALGIDTCRSSWSNSPSGQARPCAQPPSLSAPGARSFPLKEVMQALLTSPGP